MHRIPVVEEQVYTLLLRAAHPSRSLRSPSPEPDVETCCTTLEQVGFYLFVSHASAPGSDLRESQLRFVKVDVDTSLWNPSAPAPLHWEETLGKFAESADDRLCAVARDLFRLVVLDEAGAHTSLSNALHSLLVSLPCVRASLSEETAALRVSSSLEPAAFARRVSKLFGAVECTFTRQARLRFSTELTLFRSDLLLD
jgi:hypothetical protein